MVWVIGRVFWIGSGAQVVAALTQLTWLFDLTPLSVPVSGSR